MGVGLAKLIELQGRDVIGGYPYIEFLGPGILAASCMQTASFESSFPILGKIQWRRNYEAILATPLGVRHIVAGELLWIGFRVATWQRLPGVLTLFGIPRTPLALLAIPCAILTGLAFAAAIELHRHPAHRGGLQRGCSASSSTRSSCSRAPSSRSSSCPTRCSGSPRPRRCTTACHWCAASSSRTPPSSRAGRSTWRTCALFAGGFAWLAHRLLMRRLQS